MKITRRQLRQLIINEVRIKPGGELSPEYLEKLTSMVDTDDEAFITQADELAPMLGYEGDSFAQDIRAYKYVSIMDAVGEFAHYLTDKHMKMLMNIKDKVISQSLKVRQEFSIFRYNTESLELLNHLIVCKLNRVV